MKPNILALFVFLLAVPGLTCASPTPVVGTNGNTFVSETPDLFVTPIAEVPTSADIWIVGQLRAWPVEGGTQVELTGFDEVWIEVNYLGWNPETCYNTPDCYATGPIEYLRISVWDGELYGQNIVNADQLNTLQSFYMMPRFQHLLTEQPVNSLFWQAPDGWLVRLADVKTSLGGTYILTIEAGYFDNTHEYVLIPSETEQILIDEKYLVIPFSRPDQNGDETFWIEVWK